MKGKKFGADDTRKSFGPGHDGWYAVGPRTRNEIRYRKAKSAFQAAALAGCSLVEALVVPVTDAELIAKLNSGEIK